METKEQHCQQLLREKRPGETSRARRWRTRHGRKVGYLPSTSSILFTLPSIRFLPRMPDSIKPAGRRLPGKSGHQLLRLDSSSSLPSVGLRPLPREENVWASGRADAKSWAGLLLSTARTRLLTRPCRGGSPPAPRLIDSPEIVHRDHRPSLAGQGVSSHEELLVWVRSGQPCCRAGNRNHRWASFFSGPSASFRAGGAKPDQDFVFRCSALDSCDDNPIPVPRVAGEVQDFHQKAKKLRFWRRASRSLSRAKANFTTARARRRNKPIF